MDDLAQPPPIAWLDNDVHVVWHDAPREKAIALTIKMQDCVFDQLRDGWLPQPTLTKTAIEPLICLSEVVALCSKGFRHSSRKAVEEPKGDELDRLS